MLITTPVLQGSSALQGYPATPEEAKAAGGDIWCTTRSGKFMCLPRTTERAGTFKGLQRAINTWIDVKGHDIAKVEVDGRIGPETLAAANRIAPALGMGVFPDAPTLTENHIGFTARLAQSISAEGSTVYKPDTSTTNRPGEKPTNAAVATNESEAQKKLIEQMTPGFGTPPSIWWFVGGVAVLGLGYYGYKKYKERQEGVVVEED